VAIHKHVYWGGGREWQCRGGVEMHVMPHLLNVYLRDHTNVLE
jgi:hypothetical protein